MEERTKELKEALRKAVKQLRGNNSQRKQLISSLYTNCEGLWFLNLDQNKQQEILNTFC